MGLLRKLWDDTLAGPTPETGLSKLRRCQSSSTSSSFYSSPPSTPTSSHVDNVPVSRSITILRTASSRYSSAGSRSIPTSPTTSTSTPSGSPFSPAASRGEIKRLMRRKLEVLERAEPRSPTVEDWVVISALDR